MPNDKPNKPLDPVMMIPDTSYIDEYGPPARFRQRKNPIDAKQYDYRAARTNLKCPNGVSDSVVHMTMYSLSTGLVALHSAYQECGLWVALALTFFLAFLGGYCACMIVWSAQKLYGRVQMSHLTYPEVVEAAVLLSPWPKFRKSGRYFRYALEGTLLIHLYGSCCVSILMIARNLKELVEGTETLNDAGDPPLKVYILSLIVPCTAVCMVTNLKILAPFALVAISYAVAVILMTIWYGFKTASVSPLDRPPYKDLKGVFEFIGVYTFVIETASIALPIENNMDKPQNFHFVALANMLIVGFMMMTAGFFGYWSYGEKAMAPITIHFPFSPFGIQIKVMLCLVLYVIYAISFYVAFDIEWFYIRTRHQVANFWFWERIYRAVHVIIIGLVGFALPNVTRLMGIFGSLTTSPIVYMYPPFVELLVDWEYPGLGRYRWRVLKFIAFMLFGLAAFFAGTFFNIVGYIDEIPHLSIEFNETHVERES